MSVLKDHQEVLRGFSSSVIASPVVSLPLGPSLPQGLAAAAAQLSTLSPFRKATSGTKTRQMAPLKVQAVELSGSREATKTLLRNLAPARRAQLPLPKQVQVLLGCLRGGLRLPGLCERGTALLCPAR